MEHLWNHTDKGQEKYSEKILFHCQVTHHRFQVHWPEMEPDSVQ